MGPRGLETRRITALINKLVTATKEVLPKGAHDIWTRVHFVNNNVKADAPDE